MQPVQVSKCMHLDTVKEASKEVNCEEGHNDEPQDGAHTDAQVALDPSNRRAEPGRVVRDSGAPRRQAVRSAEEQRLD